MRITKNPIIRWIDARIRKSISYMGMIFTDSGAVRSNQGKYMKGEKTTEAYGEELYVYGCVFLISNTIASIPLRIYQDETKQKEILNHPAYDLFKKPNFKDSWYDIKEAVSACLELDGNAFMLAGTGVPEQVFVLVPKSVDILKGKQENIQTMEDYIGGYKYGEKKYKVEEVLHERKFNVEENYRGMSPIKAAALNIDTVTEAKRQNYNIFANGMNKDTAFESEEPFDDVSYKRLKQDLKEKNSGTANAHEPLILFNGLKYKQAGISAKDLEYIAGLKMNRDEICGFLYQVPPILLGILENSSYNNIKEAKAIFYEFSIIPRLVKNRELYQRLIDRFEAGGYIDFDLSGINVLQEDQKEKIEKAGMLWDKGVSIKILNGMFKLGIPEYKGWDIGYIPFSVVPAGQEQPAGPAGDSPGPAKTVKKIVWTEEKKVLKWNKFSSTIERHKNAYKKDLRSFFTDQKKEVLGNLEQYKSFGYEKLAENTYAIIAEIDGQKKAINLDAILFDKVKEVRRLKKVSLPNHRRAAAEQAATEYSLLGLDTAFDINNPRIAKWLLDNALKKATFVNETVYDAVKQALIDEINAGGSVAQITDKIREIYQPYIELEGYEAERIARTEILGAANEGALESYKQADISKKGWLSSRRVTSRPFHVAMEEKYAAGIPLGEDFVSETGASGPAPGQMGSAEDDINCGCSIIPITE